MDADLENPTDQTLSSINILPLVRNLNGTLKYQNRDVKKGNGIDSAKLIIADKNVSNEIEHKKIGSEILDITDQSQYSYDQKI